MDALVILCIGLFFTYSRAKVVKEQEIVRSGLEVRRNDDFYRNNNAFMLLHNKIMNKDV